MPEVETFTVTLSVHFGSNMSFQVFGASSFDTRFGLYAMPAMLIAPQVHKPSGWLYSAL